MFKKIILKKMKTYSEPFSFTSGPVMDNHWISLSQKNTLVFNSPLEGHHSEKRQRMFVNQYTANLEEAFRPRQSRQKDLVDNSRRSQLKKKALALKYALKEQCMAEKIKSEPLNTSAATLEDSSCPRKRKQKDKNEFKKNLGRRKCNLFMLLAKFKRHCQIKLEKGLKLGVLFELMACYREIIKPAVCTFYKSSKVSSELKLEVSEMHLLEVSRLKSVMSRMHMFFHMYYSAINTPTDRDLYLEIMSDLMSMYVDMEIMDTEASCIKIENIKKTASIITSSFMVLFGDKADDYILDCLLKSHVPTQPSLLCDLIFRRILRSAPQHFIDALSYIRYLLAFKVWESIVENPEQKCNIKRVAILLLNPPIKFREQIDDVDSLQWILPEIPEGCEGNSVTAYLMDKKFSLNEAIKNYFITSDDPKVFLYAGRRAPNSHIIDDKKIEIVDMGNDDDYLVQSDCYKMDYEDKMAAFHISELSLCEVQKEESFLFPPVLPDDIDFNMVAKNVEFQWTEVIKEKRNEVEDIVGTDCLPSSTENEPWSILAYLEETSQSPSSSTDRGINDNFENLNSISQNVTQNSMLHYISDFGSCCFLFLIAYNVSICYHVYTLI